MNTARILKFDRTATMNIADPDHRGAQWMRIRSGLLTAEHHEAIGEALWLYLYLHQHVNFKTGIMKGYRHGDASADLGIPERTIKFHMRRLEKAGYVTVTQSWHSCTVAINRYHQSDDAPQTDDELDSRVQPIASDSNAVQPVAFDKSESSATYCPVECNTLHDGVQPIALSYNQDSFKNNSEQGGVGEEEKKDEPQPKPKATINAKEKAAAKALRDEEAYQASRAALIAYDPTCGPLLDDWDEYSARVNKTGRKAKSSLASDYEALAEAHNKGYQWPRAFRKFFKSYANNGQKYGIEYVIGIARREFNERKNAIRPQEDNPAPRPIAPQISWQEQLRQRQEADAKQQELWNKMIADRQAQNPIVSQFPPANLRPNGPNVPQRQPQNGQGG